MQSRKGIYEEIDGERLSQDERWGNQIHTLPVWAAILAEECEECGEVAEATLQVEFRGDGHLAHLRAELIQVAAVAVHIIEKIDNESWVRSISRPT